MKLIRVVVNFRVIQTKVDGPVFLAGEAFTLRGGCVEGALESVERLFAERFHSDQKTVQDRHRNESKSGLASPTSFLPDLGKCIEFFMKFSIGIQNIHRTSAEQCSILQIA